MPNLSTLTSEDKQTIKKCIPRPTNKIITAAVARLYVAHPNPNEWRFTGISGAIVFTYDVIGNTLFLKMVDISSSNRGIIWDQELYENFQYHQDRTFFHSFELEKCMAGLSFADVNEASAFYRRVNGRLGITSHKNTPAPEGSKTNTKKKYIDKSKIGAPSHFKHVSHIGWDSEKGFTAENIDPSWKKLFDDLGQFGFSYEQIEENKDLIQEYVERNGGLGAANQVSESSQTNASVSHESIRRSRLPPPPPLPPLPASSIPSSKTDTIKKSPSSSSSRRVPPPPPRKSHVFMPETNRASESISVPPSPPPLRTSVVNQHKSLHVSMANTNTLSQLTNSTENRVSSESKAKETFSHESSIGKSSTLSFSGPSSSDHSTYLNSDHTSSSTSASKSDASFLFSNKDKNITSHGPAFPSSSRNSVLSPQLSNKTSTSDGPSGSLSTSALPPPPPPPPPPSLPPPLPALLSTSSVSRSASLGSSNKGNAFSASRLSGEKVVSSHNTTSADQIPDPPSEFISSVDRSNLMASIRSSGGVSMLRKVEPASSSRSSSSCFNGTSRSANGAGGHINLEDALVAVLNHRKGKVTLSDDDESEDDDWDD